MAQPEYQFAHLGVNTESSGHAEEIAGMLQMLFGLPNHDLQNSIYVGHSIEVMKQTGRGQHGHIAIATNDIEAAIQDLAAKGVSADMRTAGYREEQLISVYLDLEIAGFAVHLLQP